MAAPQVELRTLRPDDEARLLAWRNSPEVARYMYTDHQISESEHARWFAGIEGDARRAYWIVEVDGKPAGLSNFYDIDRSDRRCAWAWYLADLGARGRGVGRYLQYWMAETAFGRMALQKLWCEALTSNTRALHLYRSSGFQEEAQFRRQVLKNGALHEVVGLALLAEDWVAIRARMAEALATAGFAVPQSAGQR